MAEFPALPLFTDAITADCSHLTDEEFGRYVRVLILMWRSPACRIPADAQWICKRLRVDALAYAQLVQPILQEFCTQDAGFWTQKRLLKEYQYVQALTEKRRKAAASRWSKTQVPENKQKRGMQMDKQSTSKSDAPTPTPTPTESLSKDKDSPIPPKGGLPSTLLMPDGKFESVDGFFERLWQLYPAIRDKGHKGKALEELKRKLKEGTDYETIGRGVAKYRRYCDSTGEKQPDFWRWIRDEGFNRDYGLPAATPPNARRGAGYSLEAAHAQAVADKTKRPEGSEERLKGLGIHDDPGDL